MIITVIALLISVAGCNQQKEIVLEPTQIPLQNTSDIFEAEEFSEKTVIDITEAEKLKGKQVEFEKKDITEFAKYNSVNRMRSRDVDGDQQSLFCVDQNTGAVYFINQNKDWFIYQIYNGKTEVAVELPARELYMWEGTLYFIVEDYDKYTLRSLKRFIRNLGNGVLMMCMVAVWLQEKRQSFMWIIKCIRMHL